MLKDVTKRSIGDFETACQTEGMEYPCTSHLLTSVWQGSYDKSSRFLLISIYESDNAVTSRIVTLKNELKNRDSCVCVLYQFFNLISLLKNKSSSDFNNLSFRLSINPVHRIFTYLHRQDEFILPRDHSFRPKQPYPPKMYISVPRNIYIN